MGEVGRDERLQDVVARAEDPTDTAIATPRPSRVRMSFSFVLTRFSSPTGGGWKPNQISRIAGRRAATRFRPRS